MLFSIRDFAPGLALGISLAIRLNGFAGLGHKGAGSSPAKAKIKKKGQKDDSCSDDLGSSHRSVALLGKVARSGAKIKAMTTSEGAAR